MLAAGNSLSMMVSPGF